MNKTWGFDALEQTFNKFSRDDKRKTFMDAYKKAFKPTVDQAKANIPNSKTGNLYRSMGIVPMDDRVGVFVGARVVYGFKGYHGHLLEEGTALRFYTTKKGNRHETGRMGQNKAYSRFFQKAVEATEAEAVSTITDEWHKAIERMIVKKGKQYDR